MKPVPTTSEIAMAAHDLARRVDNATGYAGLLAQSSLRSMRHIALRRRLAGEAVHYAEYEPELERLRATQLLVNFLQPDGDAALQLQAAINEIRFLARRSREVVLEAWS
ncbi:Uncharacterised protein [Bordetella ansorpii]|uniref:Uncharacterized protein n=1 Tax=Bordetella ansorpii TaxID=288768 RepID=A0A157RM09_9BORD|nr:hypothetical protein [Bordetella ansorpii]SAI59032.1 Uncharacterised protein [Bordetella ansorpii]